VIGLTVLVDDEGQEFVYYKAAGTREAVLTHIDEVPHTKLHRVKMGESGPVQKRLPVTSVALPSPDLPAFAQVARVGDTIHPDSPVLKQ
jgi:hypothetical protein